MYWLGVDQMKYYYELIYKDFALKNNKWYSSEYYEVLDMGEYKEWGSIRTILKWTPIQNVTIVAMNQGRLWLALSALKLGVHLVKGVTMVILSSALE